MFRTCTPGNAVRTFHMCKRFRFILVTAFLASWNVCGEPQPAPSNGILRLALEDAVVFALENNRDLEIEEFNPIIAGAFEQTERSAFDTEFFAELEVAEETGSETSRSTGEKFAVEASDLEATLGLRRRFATGAELEATIEQARSESDRAPEQEEARIGLALNQPLLQGLGPSVNLAAVRQAELNTRASRFELRGFTESLLSECEIAYWRLVLAMEEIAIFEESLDVARRQQEEIDQRIEVGSSAVNDAAAARAEVARREQALIEARSLLEKRRLQLLRLILPDSLNDAMVIITPTSNPYSKAPPVSNVLERIAIAEQQRPDLNEARLRLEQDRLETVVTRNGILPKLDLFISLGKTGYADSFSDAVRDLNGDGYDWRAGVQMSYFAGNRESDSRHAAALATEQQAQVAVGNLRDLVRLDVRLAINEVERLRQQIEASAVTRALQEQSLQAERERFAVGSSTSLLVAQAQRDLLAARIAEIEAIVNYRMARVRLYLAEGSLLERRGILVETP